MQGRTIVTLAHATDTDHGKEQTMKTRTIRYIAATLAVLALLAGYAMTGSEAEAQSGTGPGGTVGQGETTLGNAVLGAVEAIREELREQCEAAWYRSPASGTCDFRSGGVSLEVPDCVVRAHCRHSFYAGGEYITGYIGSDWRGSVEDTRRLKNCNGNLRLYGC